MIYSTTPNEQISLRAGCCWETEIIYLYSILVLQRMDSQNLVRQKRYCCEKKCFKQPHCQVDGIACRKCEGFSYCRCRCETYRDVFIKKNTPTLQEYKFYKTKHYITCCPAVCIKFSIDNLLDCCSNCYPQMFCTCYLNRCKQQKSSSCCCWAKRKKSGGRAI